jgi:hypothetical protein
MRKSAKNAKICEKVQNANGMRKRNQNSHRIASPYYSKKFAFLHFFASHLHRTTIPVRTVGDFATAIQEIEQQGQIFEIEINYANCQTGDVQLDGIAGGIIWETYINPDRNSEFLLFRSNLILFLHL